MPNNNALPQMSYRNSGWPRYRFFGLTVASDFRLLDRVAVSGNSTPDLTFTCTEVESFPNDWTRVSPTYISPYLTKGGESILRVYDQPECVVLHFTDTAEFYVWPDRIVCYQLRRAYRYQVEMWLVGTVLALWLEQKGIPVMHASAVVVDNRAMAFLASSTAGKSSLAAALMRCGYPLLTDNVLPITCCGDTYVGQPGYPQMRLWPDQAKHFLGYFEDLELVHPEASKRTVPVGSEGLGGFCDVSQPLSCLYIPYRRDSVADGTAIEITPVSPRDTTIELVRHSFLTRLLTAMGLQPQRLHSLAHIARQVPMRQVMYPSGLEHLPRVCEAILEDAKKAGL